MKRPAQIDLVIDEVVLYGFSADARGPFSDALEQALMRELSSPMLQRALAKGGEVQLLDTGATRLPPASAPRAVGDSVARAVAGGLRGATRTPTRKRP